MKNNQSKKNKKPNTKPSSNESFNDWFDSLPTVPKSKKDYGKITVEALRRATKEFYRAQDLADKLDLNIMTIYRYIKAGKLKAYKIGKEYRIEKREFSKFLEKVSTK